MGEQATASKLAILGNGPSLSDIDLRDFGDIPTFGFNAAYRYWDRIGWYPTYYACLDTVVGLSHRDAIARMIRSADDLGIQTFYLRMNLAAQLSDMANADKIVTFERFMRRHGVDETYPTVTTGSHAAIIAMLLGYRALGLYGVDANYQDLKSGASVAGNVLVASETPDTNPNYFFADYQQSGDIYHVPNPGRDLHREAWGQAAAAAAARGCQIVNCSPRSKLDLFPRVTHTAFLGQDADQWAAPTGAPATMWAATPSQRGSGSARTEADETQIEALIDRIRQLAGDPAKGHAIMALCQIVCRARDRFVPATPLSDPRALCDDAVWRPSADADHDALAALAERQLIGDLVSDLVKARDQGRPVAIHGSGTMARRALAALRAAGHRPDLFVTPTAYHTVPAIDDIPVLAADHPPVDLPRLAGGSPFVVIGSGHAVLLDDYLEAGYVLHRDVFA